MLWPLIFDAGLSISFAYKPFHWSKLASDNAGVTVVIVGVEKAAGEGRVLLGDDGCAA